MAYRSATQLPAVTSCAGPATVWENVVAEVQRTDVVPANWLDTVIDEPDTEATEPDVAGRLLGAVVVVDPDEADGAAEPPELPQAAPTMPRAATNSTGLGPPHHNRRPSNPEDRTRMTPPFILTRSTPPST